jgi:AcrR family transcriptional regulator
VSTREIAAAASVPAHSLQYYFENTRGLYVACLEHIQAVLYQSVEPALRKAESLLEDGHAKLESLVDAFCAVQEALVDRMIGFDDGTMALFIVRHDMPSEAGANKFSGDGGPSYRMMACFSQLMMRISGNTLDRQTALIVAGLINGQLTTIYLRRGRLAEGGWNLNVEQLGWLKQTIRKQTTAALLIHGVGSAARS